MRRTPLWRSTRHHFSPRISEIRAPVAIAVSSTSRLGSLSRASTFTVSSSVRMRSGRGCGTSGWPSSCHPFAGRLPNSGNTSTNLRDPFARELRDAESVFSIASLQSAPEGYRRLEASSKSNCFNHLRLDHHRPGGFSLANVERLPGARHANIEKPDHRIPLRSIQLVGRVTSRAEIRKQKDNIRFAALYRVDRSDDDARRFLDRKSTR